MTEQQLFAELKEDIKEIKDVTLKEIRDTLKEMLERGSETRERVTKLETQVEYLEKTISDNKNDADRRFATVWRVGGGVVTTVTIVSFGLLFALIQSGIIG